MNNLRFALVFSFIALALLTVSLGECAVPENKSLAVPSQPPVANEANRIPEKQNGNRYKKDETSVKPPPSQPATPAPIENVHPQRAEKPEKTTPPDGHQWLWWWPPSAEWITAIVAFVYTLISFFQLRAIRRQANIAENSLRISARAWLSVTFDHPFQPRVGHQSPITFSVRNTGKTVALLKGWKTRAKMWESSCIPKRELEQKSGVCIPTVTTIFPTDTLILDGLVDIVITQDQINDMVSGGFPFDVYGYILYDDIFSKRHITRFCHVYNARTQGFDFPREPQTGYNDAD